MKKLKKAWIMTLLMVLVIAWITPVPAEAATIKLDRKRVTLEVGKSTTIKLTGAKVFRWVLVSSGNGNVIKYKTNGNSMTITAKEAGEACVAAEIYTYGRIRGFKCRITVKEKPVINVTAKLYVSGLKDDWRHYYIPYGKEDSLITLYKGDKGKFYFKTTSNSDITSKTLKNIKFKVPSYAKDWYGAKCMKLSSDGSFLMTGTPQRDDCITEWIDICATGEYKGTTVNIEFTNHPEVGNQRLIDSFAKVEKVSKQIITPEMNDGEKILAVHDWICLNNYYASDYASGDDADRYLPGAILDGATYSDGYTEAFSAFMQYLGMEERVNDAYHGWNQVKLDGEWYYIDVSGDDRASAVGYDSFLQSGRHVEEIYEPDRRDDNSDSLTTGTYWRYKVFEKYKVTSEEEARAMLNSQADKPIRHILFSNTDYSETYRIGSNLRKELETDDFGLIVITYDGMEYYLYSYTLQ